jgi:hypothetical protein
MQICAEAHTSAGLHAVIAISLALPVTGLEELSRCRKTRGHLRRCRSFIWFDAIHGPVQFSASSRGGRFVAIRIFGRVTHRIICCGPQSIIAGPAFGIFLGFDLD